MNIKEFIVTNIIWEILSAIIISFFGLILFKHTGIKNIPTLIKGQFKVKKTVKMLINNNRISKGGVGLPKHLADRFIDIWLTTDKCFIKYGYCEQSPHQDRYIISFGGSTYSTAYQVKYIDDLLQNNNLIIIDNENNIVKPVRNVINKRIYKECRKLLISYGDSEKFYQDKEKVL